MGLEDLVSSIEKLKKKIGLKQDEAEIASQQSNDEGLSVALGSLARFNSALGQKAAYAKYIARNSNRAVERLKEQKDAERSRMTLELSQTQAVGKSEHQARIDIMSWIPKIDEAFDIYSQAKLIADQADDLTYRTDTMLKMAQSRLSLLKADKHRG